MIYINAFFLACARRTACTSPAALYGWEHGLLSLPRMVVGNFVNCMAVARAWRMFLSYLFRGRASLGQDDARLSRHARLRGAASAWANCCIPGASGDGR